MKTRLLLLIVLSALVQTAGAWSSKGHQVVAYIAKCHLSAEAAAELNRILDGNSIVYFASWLDTVKGDEYAYTSTWHYVNVDEGEDYFHRSSLAYIDAAQALYAMSDSLRAADTSEAGRELAAKIIVHVVGDLHQPMHAGHASDKGGNYIYVNFLGKRKNLHSVWDYDIVNAAHDWSYYQWQQNIDTTDEGFIEEITAGSIDDWAMESVAVAANVYTAFPAGTNITPTDVEEWTPVVEQQLLRGGLRLAALLNDIFSATAVIIMPNSEPDAADIIYNIHGAPVATAATLHFLRPGIYLTAKGRKFVVR